MYLCPCRIKRTSGWWKDWQLWPTHSLKLWTNFILWRHSWKNHPTRGRRWRQERRKLEKMFNRSVLKSNTMQLFNCRWSRLFYIIIFPFQTITRLENEIDGLTLEKQNMQKEFEASSKEMKGKKNPDSCVCKRDSNLYQRVGVTFLQRGLIKQRQIF